MDPAKIIYHKYGDYVNSPPSVREDQTCCNWTSDSPQSAPPREKIVEAAAQIANLVEEDAWDHFSIPDEEKAIEIIETLIRQQP